MKAPELVAELRRRNHGCFYHACTLLTFQSYCALGAYRSRHNVTAAGLPLSPQMSDEADKHLGIWDHLFLNIYDQHGDVHKGKSVTGINKYGPIVMAFDIDAVANYTGEIKGYTKEITAAAYSPSAHDVVTMSDFRSNTFRDASATSTSDAPARRPGTPGPNMCVHCAEEDGGVPFDPYLREVIVDALPSSFSKLQSEVMTEVESLVQKHAPHAKLTLRECIPGCYCRVGYSRMTENDARRFFLETNMHVYTMRLRT